jgi:dihydroneopterin aldolase
MDKIIISGLTVYGYCGVSQEEQKAGQKLLIDIELTSDLSRAARTDRLKDTIDYKRVSGFVAEVLKEKKYHLLEALAEDLAKAILHSFGPQEVRVRVRKYHAPIGEIVDWVGCEVIRSRD